MDFAHAVRWVERADPTVTRDRSPGALLAHLKEKARTDGGELTDDAAAAWYAIVHEMRRQADAYERDLIRTLRAGGRTWAQVADAVQAQLSSRQAAQAKWKRLLDPTRRTTNGDMRRGGRRRATPDGTDRDEAGSPAPGTLPAP